MGTLSNLARLGESSGKEDGTVMVQIPFQPFLNGLSAWNSFFQGIAANTV
jgi:hypothetical protein